MSDLHEPPDSPEDPDEHSEVPTSEGTHFLELFYRPGRFFRIHALTAVPAAAWIVGFGTVLERTENSIERGRVPAAVGTDWMVYWLWCGGTAVIAGAFGYWGLGWWYTRRLRWSGADRNDTDRGRAVFIYASLTHAIPSMLVALWATASYGAPREFVLGYDWSWLVTYLALLWSVGVSYRGAHATFELRKWSSRIWLLILPLGVYLGLFGLVVALGVSGEGGRIEPPPNLRHPVQLTRERFALQYPGNWAVDTADEDYHPDLSFAIAPTYADAMLRVEVYDQPLDPEASARQTLEGLSSVHEVDNVEELIYWGALDGAGYTGDIEIEGRPYVFLVFSATEEDPPLEILQIAERVTWDKLRPGFELIATSFRLR